MARVRYRKGINLASKFEWSQLAKAVSAKLAKISGIYLGEHFTEIPLLVSILRNFNLKTFSKISASPYYYTIMNFIISEWLKKKKLLTC